MASKTSAKKRVSTDDLKRLMKKMKTEGAIVHPLAKYPLLALAEHICAH